MDKFQIRTSAHPFGELWISSNMAGNIVLETEDGTRVNLGKPEDALLVAKCIEVCTRRDTSDEFAEASREDLSKALEQLKADHELKAPQNHE